MFLFDDGAAVRRLFDRGDEVRIEPLVAVNGAPFTIATDDHREDLDVQVRLAPQGAWHKKAIGGRDTACGESIENYFARAETYAGLLCPTCFTPHEQNLAKHAAAIEYPTTPDPK